MGHEEAENVRSRIGDGHSIGGGIEGYLGDEDQPFRSCAVEGLPILLFSPVGRRSTRALQVNDGGNVSGSGKADQTSPLRFSQKLRAAFHKHLGVGTAQVVRLQSFGRHRSAGLQFFPAETGDHFDGGALDRED